MGLMTLRLIDWASVSLSLAFSHVVSDTEDTYTLEPSRFYPSTPIGPPQPDLDNRRELTWLAWPSLI